MADEDVKKFIKLPEGTKKKLEDGRKQILRAKKLMESMKDMDMDVSAIEDKVDWALKVSDTLLKDFV